MRSDSRPLSGRRPPPRKWLTRSAVSWHNAKFRALLLQIALLSVVIVLAALMIKNAQDAMARRGVATGFAFLFREAGFPIGEGLLPFKTTDSYLRAFAAALVNTLTVSAVSIVAATLLGLLIGFGRLSSNWFVSRLSAAYVELFRNTPQLVQLSFWYLLMTQVPAPRQAWNFGGLAYLSNRGLNLPLPVANSTYAWVALAFILGCGAAAVLARFNRAHLERTGERRDVRLPALALIAGLPIGSWLVLGAPHEISIPVAKGFGFEGGATISPEFLVLALGLSLYIAAFIAEIVRAGLQSVSRGQIEAARSIGLTPTQIKLKVVLPQALRVMVPPLATQYISLTKNSSLGVAIGYPELFNITNTATTLSGQTIECMALMAACYLLISFSIAAVMSGVNRLVLIRER